VDSLDTAAPSVKIWLPMISPSEWRAKGQSLDWRGLRIFYRTQGSGEPLLLLHGFPTSSWDWKDLWDELAARYQVIAFDYVGFGFSGKPANGPYSIFSYADQAQFLLQTLGIAKFHLLAHDLGDSVAQELLARKAAIQTVCLLNGGLFPELHRPRPIQKLLASPIGFLATRLINQKKFEQSFGEVFGIKPSKEEMDGYWECVKDGVPIYHRLIGYMRERRQHRDRWVSALLDESIPLAFVDGLVDPVSGAHMVGKLRETRPGARITELPGIGHYPQNEAPSEVLAAYRAFRSQ
jgi:pimeloyl-ACP methyl ester carboxylesterase